MAALILTVLRHGGEYKVEHVQRLFRQAPGLMVLSDVDVPGVPRIPMRNRWPGWWSKMNLFDPDIPGDLLYMDLDTTVVGEIDDLRETGRTTMLADFYWPERLASGFMYLTEADRAKVWNLWGESPDHHMVRHRQGGDQSFIASVLPDALRWQDTHPGRVVSYKAHIAAPGMAGFNSRRSQGDGFIPAGASVVCFHGSPRPWEAENLKWR